MARIVALADLAADTKGKKNLQKRLTDARMLLEGLALDYDKHEFDLQLSCHHVILLGDLNFRVDLPAASALDYLSRRELLPVLRADELLSALEAGETLHGFREAAIPTFLPSYRRVAGEPGRLTKDELAAGSLPPERLRQLYTLAAASDGTERTPSYTDRVLLHSLPGMRPSLLCMGYTSGEHMIISDHRPVGADLELFARPTQVAVARCELKLRDLQFTAVAESSAAHAPKAAKGGGSNVVEFLHLLLPLPCEQACFALERVNALSGVIGAHAAGQLQASVNSELPWVQVCPGAEGISVTAGGLQASRVHAALRLLGANGEERGQGVLAVAAAEEPHATETDTDVAWADGRLRSFGIELSLQGRLVGSLRGACSARWVAG